jgi:hypothetical protein
VHFDRDDKWEGRYGPEQKSGDRKPQVPPPLCPRVGMTREDKWHWLELLAQWGETGGRGQGDCNLLIPRGFQAREEPLAEAPIVPN